VADVPGLLVDITARLLSEVRAELGEEADYLEAIKWIESRAGVVIGADPAPLAAARRVRSVSGPMHRTIQ
jgi:hypothetical protein